MLIACWSPKGGSGTTVLAALLAVLAARVARSGVLAVDLAGDLPAALGVPDPAGPGLAEWLAAAPDVGPEALSRLEVEVGPSLHLLHRGVPGAGFASSARAELLASSLAAGERVVMADCGAADRTPALEVAAGATLSLVVVRPCYLALRRVLAAPVRATGIVLVDEPERALRRRDVEDVLGLPVWAEVPRDPAVARAVDAGLLSSRVPRTAQRALERAALEVAS